MTEETIKDNFINWYLNSPKDGDKYIKQLLEQHEAEMVEAMNWISEDGWVKYKGVDRWKNDSEIALFGVLRTKKYKLQPQTTTDLLTLFKNRNK